MVRCKFYRCSSRIDLHSLGRPSPKVTESQKPSDAPHSKSVTLEEADAFRGVHLDPNAHHWDEVRFNSLFLFIFLTFRRWKKMMTIFWTESSNLVTEDSTRYHRLKLVRKTYHHPTQLRIQSSPTQRLLTAAKHLLVKRIGLRTTLTGDGHDQGPLHRSCTRIYHVLLDIRQCPLCLRILATRLRKVQEFFSMNAQTDLSHIVLIQIPVISLGLRSLGEALI